MAETAETSNCDEFERKDCVFVADWLKTKGLHKLCSVFEGVLTCDQASLLFYRGGKVRLIQLLDFLSVASPESGLFSDWSRNKRYLELSHNWFPEWQCDFRSKKSPELTNAIMTSDPPLTMDFAIL